MPDAATPGPSRLLRGEVLLDDPLVRELLDARLIAVLCTSEPDGTIHAVPMWFAREGRSIVLATSSASRKVENLALDTRATLVLHDSRPGTEICGASIRGRVEIHRAAEAERLVEAVHARYVAPAGLALPAVREFLTSDDVALRLLPESAFTWDERGSPATAALRGAGAALPLLSAEPRRGDR